MDDRSRAGGYAFDERRLSSLLQRGAYEKRCQQERAHVPLETLLSFLDWCVGASPTLASVRARCWRVDVRSSGGSRTRCAEVATRAEGATRVGASKCRSKCHAQSSGIWRGPDIIAEVRVFAARAFAEQLRTVKCRKRARREHAVPPGGALHTHTGRVLCVVSVLVCVSVHDLKTQNHTQDQPCNKPHSSTG